MAAEGAGGSGSGPGPAVVSGLLSAEPTACGLPRDYVLRPWAKGPRRVPGSMIFSVLQVTGLELAARTRRPVGFHSLLSSSCESCLAAVGNKTPDASLASVRAS